ncbi:hypothetical protein CAPTEDRAFT_154109 [Capitella teleta]|uniref:Outer dynein arm-docking complex subunit 4 n=1 Tax=Capitella teleta TaxID=283909 RepID=R7VJL4_CAPTE|nr:hypothetical protein CAPTEDRAFT_154109 [Capitella teleta]|eukprot:ELU16005.1 hypothetical protein CAPTEDRAFT_154109 [Capitella teleta]
MYARKKRPQDDNGNRGQGSPGGRRDPTPWVLRNLEQIDEAQVEGRHEDSLKQAKKVLKEIEKWSDDDISNRSEVVANLHSCIGNAYLELEEYSFALSHHNKDNEIATQKDLSDAKSRALDNLGRVHARMGNFEKAIEVWEEKLPMSKSSLESTWLYHEIGRCYLEMSDNQKAKDYGEKSLSAAEEASDDVWQLNACVLIAQSEVKLGELQEALDSFEKSLDMAKVQGDSAAEGAIKKALEDVNNRIVSGIKESGEEGAANEQNEETQSNDYEEDFEKDDEKESGDEKNKDSDKESDHGKKDDS